MEEDLERFEDQALSNLDNENMSKLIDSLNMLISDINRKEYSYLVYENLLELNENLNHISYGYYPSFQGLLAKTLTLLEEVKSKCNENLKLLIGESISNIERLFKNYGYDYNPKYGKYPKYPYPTDETIKGKTIAKHLHRKSTDPHYDDRNEAQAELYNIIDNIAKKGPEDIYPEATILFHDALEKLKSDKEEYKKKIEESKSLKDSKLELANSKEELNSWRKKMLGRCIDNLISEYKEE